MTQRTSEMSHQAAAAAGWPGPSTFRQCLADQPALLLSHGRHLPGQPVGFNNPWALMVEGWAARYAGPLKTRWSDMRPALVAS